MTPLIITLLMVTTSTKYHSKLDNMEPRECTIEFIYPGETSIYEVQLVNYQPPYRHSKWLFTMMINGSPYFSYQLENDEELFIMIGKQALHATTINITYKDDKKD